MDTKNNQSEYLDKIKKLDMTDVEIGRLLGVVPRTIEAWRSGESKMAKSAKIVCLLMEKEPVLVLKTAATISG